MSIISLIIILIVVGVALYLINQVIPMDGKIKTIINVLVVVIVCIWLLTMFVNVGSLGNVGHVGPLKN
jgi:hypothetical protein